MRSGSAWGSVLGLALAALAALAAPGRAQAPEAPWPAATAPLPPAPQGPAPQGPAPPGPTPQGPAHPESLKLSPDLNSRLTLSVLVNGQGPYEFLIDTGADRTVISRELATKLNLPPGDTVVMHETAGADTVQTVRINRLTVGTRTIDDIQAPALAADNLGADGMLGVDSLRDLHVIMDFKTMRLSSAPSQPEPITGDTIVVHGRSRFGQLILVNGQIHGQKVYVVLDTGSQLSVGNLALLRLLGGTPRQDQLKETQIISVTGRRVPVQMEIVPEADLGGLEIRNLPIAFAQLHTFDRFGLVRQPALLLGMDVLSQCRKVTVDLRRREATFTLRSGKD